jgi:DNA-binding PadR family transcriptional regulator
MPFRRSDSLLPLTPIAFEILLALAEQDRHGYAILQAVEERLKGTLPLRTGTLYRALARLFEDELIEEVDDGATRGGKAAAGSGDDRRRVYRLTKRGRMVARAEAGRLSSQLAVARSRKLAPGKS